MVIFKGMDSYLGEVQAKGHDTVLPLDVIKLSEDLLIFGNNTQSSIISGDSSHLRIVSNCKFAWNTIVQ